MKYLLIAIIAILSGCATGPGTLHDSVFVEPAKFPMSAYNGPADYAITEARRAHKYEGPVEIVNGERTYGNCEIVVNAALKTLASLGEKGWRMVVVDEYSRYNHAIMCRAGTCYDNGRYGGGPFPLAEVRGKVL